MVQRLLSNERQSHPSRHIKNLFNVEISAVETKGSFPIIPDNNGLERKGNQGLNPKQRIVDTKVIDNYLQGSPSLFPGEDSMVGDNNYSSGFQS